MRVSNAIPEQFIQRVLACGREGEAWLSGLDELVFMMTLIWHLKVVGVIGGSIESLDFHTVTYDGQARVLKFFLPCENTFQSHLEALREDEKCGRVKLHECDINARALVLETLGTP